MQTIYKRAVRVVADRIRLSATPYDFSSDFELIALTFGISGGDVERDVISTARALIMTDIDDGCEPHWLMPSYRAGMRELDASMF